MKWILIFSGFVWTTVFVQHVFAQNKRKLDHHSHQKNNNSLIEKNCLKAVPDTNDATKAKDTLDVIIATVSHCLFVKQWSVIKKNLNMAEKLLSIVHPDHRNFFKILTLQLWYYYYDLKAMLQKDVDFKKEKDRKAIKLQIQRLEHRISDLEKASKKIAEYFKEISERTKKRSMLLKTPIDRVYEQLRTIRLNMIRDVIKLKIGQWQAQKNQLELYSRKAKLHPDIAYTGWSGLSDGTQNALHLRKNKGFFYSPQEYKINKSRSVLRIVANISNIQTGYQSKWNEFTRQSRVAKILLGTGIGAASIGVSGIVGGAILVGSSANLSPIHAQNFNTMGTIFLTVGSVLVILGSTAVVVGAVSKPQSHANDYSFIELYDKYPPQTQISYYHSNKQGMNNHNNIKAKPSVHERFSTIVLGKW